MWRVQLDWAVKTRGHVRKLNRIQQHGRENATRKKTRKAVRTEWGGEDKEVDRKIRKKKNGSRQN